MASMVNMEHLYKKEDESEESGTEAQACTWEAGVRPKCSVKSSNRVKSLWKTVESFSSYEIAALNRPERAEEVSTWTFKNPPCSI